MSIETEFIMCLIENVEKHKCLYDKRDAFYFSKGVKERTWKDVPDKCNKSVTDCKHRWKLLREHLVKEMKKMEAPSGSGMCYLEEWPFLQHMLFLKDSLAPRRTRDNVEDLIVTDTEESAFSQDSLFEVLSPSPPPTKRRKATLMNVCERVSETIESIQGTLTESLQSKETTDGLFSRTLEALMQDLPMDVKEDFQVQTMQELYRLRKEYRGYQPPSNN